MEATVAEERGEQPSRPETIDCIGPRIGEQKHVNQGYDRA